ncbi:hypothetical protein KY285_007799 [Solanum tuberosum]|nr:hypothetical protein KY289_008156 [Solanum tuberosum]KAH0746142.1 hypothetical protein KY285_007799 [Solanum tuberosum]
MDRISYACICVEVDVSQPLVEAIEMITPTCNFHQPIEYDWKPKFCGHCLRFGHQTDECRSGQDNPPEEEFKEGQKRKKRNRRRRKHVQQGWKVKEPSKEAVKDDMQKVTTVNPVQSVVGQPKQVEPSTSRVGTILSSDERLGSPVTPAETKDFRECLDTLQLTPLRSKGCFYSFCNKQELDHRVYSRIDWTFGNYKWIQVYGNVESDYLASGVSDHSPVLLHCTPGVISRPKPFKLFKIVLEHPKFVDIVADTWAQRHLQQTRQKLEITQDMLASSPLNKQQINEECNLIHEMHKWSMVEEKALRQKSRATWIACGDSNSKYLHAQYGIRASRNDTDMAGVYKNHWGQQNAQDKVLSYVVPLQW